LVRRRPDVRCHVAHLDHETRGGESAADAEFVAELCAELGVPCTTATRTQVAGRGAAGSGNRSAHFRALRHALFRDVCDRHGLRGVLLAHHADDQAETLFLRLLRGSGPAGLGGMRPAARVGGLSIVRPLLDVRGESLRAYLIRHGRRWREDASNASPAYQRNRARAVLREHPAVGAALGDLGRAMGGLSDWTRAAAPELGEAFELTALADVPDVLAAEAARRWLAGRGAPADELSAAVLDRLIAMARDAATPPRMHFPGGVLVGRRRGRIAVVTLNAVAPAGVRDPGAER
jgi:tRNA(Ile)-lysidine synthase